MTALSLVFPVQNLINAVMIGFGIGVNAAIAYFLGAKDTGAAWKIGKSGNALFYLSWNCIYCFVHYGNALFPAAFFCQ